jgi:hypothetical protein
VHNCVAFESNYGSKKGFDQNSHKGGVIVHNCTSFNNGYNYMFEEDPASGCVNEFKNNVSLTHTASEEYEFSAAAVQQNNSWNITGITVNAADFKSFDPALAKAPRQANGDLPDNDFAKLVAGSDLIDKGVPVGLPYSGVAPDLGAYEFGNITKVAPRKDFQVAELHLENQPGFCMVDVLGRNFDASRAVSFRAPMAIAIFRTTSGDYKSLLTNYKHNNK